ncbi:MAG: hypothetical protein ACLUHE_04195 [Christensenellales bacterium]
MIHCGFFKSVSRFAKKEARRFCRAFFLVREIGLDSRGSTPLGQRRSQAPPGLDSLRLLQVRFSVCKKRSPALLPSFFLWCGKQDWILAARRRSVSAVLKPHRGLIHCGFFKSVSRFAKKEAQRFCRAFFFGAGNRT